jgi:hypothetical protein
MNLKPAVVVVEHVNAGNFHMIAYVWQVNLLFEVLAGSIKYWTERNQLRGTAVRAARKAAECLVAAIRKNRNAPPQLLLRVAQRFIDSALQQLVIPTRLKLKKRRSSNPNR